MVEKPKTVWLRSDTGLCVVAWLDGENLVEEALWSFPRPFIGERARRVREFPGIIETKCYGRAPATAGRRLHLAESADDVLREARETAVLLLTGVRAIPYRDRAKLPVRERLLGGAVERDREQRVRLAMMAPSWEAKVDRRARRVIRDLRARGQISKRVAAELAKRGYKRRHRAAGRSAGTPWVLEPLSQLLEGWARGNPRAHERYRQAAAFAGLSSNVPPARLALRIYVLESDPGAEKAAIAKAEDRLRKQRSP